MSRSPTGWRWMLCGLLAVVVVASLVPLGAGAVAHGSTGGVTDERDDNPAPIDPALENGTGELEVLVRFEEVDDSTLTASEDGVSTLQSHAETAQAPLEDYAEGTDGVTFERGFWVTNAALVTVDRSEASLSELAAIEGVTRLSENYGIEPSGATAHDRPSTTTSPTATEPTAGTATAHSSDVTYGLERIGAPAVWEEFDTRGGGTTIAVLDSGVDPDHPDIDLYTEDPADDTYPGGWAEFDEAGDEVVGSQPHDVESHGTHVSATAVGGAESGTAIGVAPEARLIHGQVLNEDGSGTAGMLYGGIEWAIERDADVIGMSLGAECGRYVSGDIPYVRNAREAGAVPVAAIGNDGEGCTGSPANVYDTISVGATDRFGDVWGNSGGEMIDTDETWGADAPAEWPEEYVTPTVTAPGVDVYSALPNDGYGQKRGTSTATPHVAGTVALMQSATDRDVDPDEIERTLRETADDPVGEPDTRYGDGIVDAYAAVDELTVTSTITGTVTDDVTGEPIADATVSLEGEETTTAADGTYELGGLEGERTATLLVEADGYEESEETITIPEDETITRELTLLGDADLLVSVEDAHFGDGLEDATVEVGGEQGTYPGEHDADGSYTVENVPSVGEYDLTADAEGYLEDGTTVPVPEPGETTLEEPIELAGDAEIALAVDDGVTGSAISGATATVEREDGKAFTAPGETDAEGALEITVPGGGSYTLEASADGYQTGSDAVSASSDDLGSLELSLAGDAAIEVDLEDAHFGTPITDGEVEVGGEQGTYPGEHDADGSYTVESVPSVGEYDLTADAEGYLDEDRSVTAEERGPHTLESIALSGDGTLEVTVEDEAGEPIDGATVSVERDEAHFEAAETTGTDGDLEVTVPGGEVYTVEATAEEYETNATTTGSVESDGVEPVTVTLTERDDGLPGFGVGATLVAITVALLAARRR